MEPISPSKISQVLDLMQDEIIWKHKNNFPLFIGVVLTGSVWDGSTSLAY